MARRVNTKFLTILTCVVLGLLLVAVLASKFLIRESPEKYVNAGNALLAEKKYEEAVRNFAHAAALDPKNPQLRVAYGDALNELTPQDPEWLRRARHEWESALAIDAGYKPALDRMMQFWSDWANLNSTQPEVFEGLHDTAKRLHAADPKNAGAEVAMVTSVVRPWLAGVEKDQRLIEEQVAKLVELAKKYPDNADIPMFAAQAKLRLAERHRARDPESKQAAALVAESTQIVEQAVARAPSAAMYFSAAQVYHAQELTDKRNSDAWRQKKREMYKKASEVARVEDPLYSVIHINAARAVADDKAAAEKILRDLYAKLPDDQHVRLALAEHLQMDRDKDKRAEAMAILEKPFAGSGMRGPKTLLLKELQTTTLVLLTNMRLDTYATAGPDERKKLIEPIKDGIAKVEAKDGVGPRSLRLKGKLLRLQGETIEAIQTLEKARQIAEQRYRQLEQAGAGVEHWEVIDLLAKAYIETNQLGNARNLLKGLVDRFPNYDPARMLLAQILIKEGNYDAARVHVAYFKQKDPNNPDVVKLDLQLMDPKGVARDAGNEADRQKVRDAFAKLPEETKQQMLDKVNAAMVIENHGEAERLLAKAQKAHPGDYDVARMAVRVYRATGELDGAKQAVAEALKANPNDAKLQVLSRQVADLTPEGLLKVQEEELMKHPDEFVRHMGLGAIARRRNQPEESLKHYLAALKLKPQDPDANSAVFNHHLWQKQWDKADAMLDSLSRGNMDQSGGLLYRYRLAMARQDYQSALNYARQLTQRMGEFGQSWLALAQAQQATNQFDEALKSYGQALSKQSDSAEALRGSIECYYAMNRPGQAREKIRDARRALPSNPFFQELEINHELTYGNPELAIAPREEQLRRNPERVQSVMAMGQAYLATARSYIGKPDKQAQVGPLFAKARDQFRAGLTKWPDEIAFYAYFAETAARSGQLGDTEQVLKQLAARDQWKDRVEPRMLLAEFYGITNRYAEAERELREILAKEPANVEIQVRLANLLVNQNKVDDALKALEANAEQPAVTRRKVEILLTNNRVDEAEKSLEAILAGKPDDLNLLQLTASVEITQAKFDEARQRLDRAMQLDKDNATTHYFLGLMLMNQPNPDIPKAMEHLAKGKDSPSMGIDARFALSECLRRRSDVDGAIRELEAAMQSQPANKRVRLALIDAYLGLQPPRTVDADRAIKEGKEIPGMADDVDLMQREVTILANRDVKKAAELINKVLAANPNDPAVARRSLDLLLKSSNYRDAIARATEVVQKNPDAWWAYQARAVATRYLGRKEEALKDFELALDATTRIGDDFAAGDVIRTMGDVIGPDEVIPRIAPRAEVAGGEKWKIMIARLQQTKGDTASAVKTFESVLAREAELSREAKINAYRFGGTLYLLVADAKKSVDCYKKLLELVPDDMTALNNLACLLAEAVQPPDPQQGLTYSRRAYELMQKGGRRDAQVLDTHGWLLTSAGEVDQGIDVLRSSLQLRRIPDAHYHLGEAYLKKKFADQALRELELALDLYKRMKEEKQPVDPALQGKIENALTRANIMVRSKATAANAPVGANVP